MFKKIENVIVIFIFWLMSVGENKFKQLLFQFHAAIYIMLWWESLWLPLVMY